MWTDSRRRHYHHVLPLLNVNKCWLALRGCGTVREKSFLKHGWGVGDVWFLPSVWIGVQVEVKDSFVFTLFFVIFYVNRVHHWPKYSHSWSTVYFPVHFSCMNDRYEVCQFFFATQKFITKVKVVECHHFFQSSLCPHTYLFQDLYVGTFLNLKSPVFFPLSLFFWKFTGWEIYCRSTCACSWINKSTIISPFSRLISWVLRNSVGFKSFPSVLMLIKHSSGVKPSLHSLNAWVKVFVSELLVLSEEDQVHSTIHQPYTQVQ